MAAPEEYVFTFGFGHTHPVTGASLANRCVRFAGSYADARRKMVQHFGIKWAFQYEVTSYPTGVDELPASDIPPARNGEEG